MCVCVCVCVHFQETVRLRPERKERGTHKHSTERRNRKTHACIQRAKRDTQRCDLGERRET